MFVRWVLSSLFVLLFLTPRIGSAQMHYGPPSGEFSPAPYSTYQQCGPGYGSGGFGSHGNTVFEELPDDRGWMFGDSEMSRTLNRGFRHAYFRAEYLHWDLGKPGNSLLGEQLLSGDDPADGFQAAHTSTGIIGEAVAPTMKGINLDATNGFRGMFGIPIGSGAFEFTGMILKNGGVRRNLTDQISPADVGPPVALAQFIASPVTIGGALSNSSIVYTESYKAILNTSAWGGEANYVFNFSGPERGDVISFSPIVGARYLNIDESLNQSGNYNAGTIVNRRIESSTVNNSYGPQIGVRGEANISRLTLGIEPKMMFGVNTYEARLHTERVLNATEAVLNLEESKTTFGPIADLKLYSRFAMTQNFHLFASYNLLWAGLITRPFENIDYNLTTVGVATVNDFKLDVNTTDMVLQGLSFGAEFRY
ncbi:MAG: hypothetical protein FJ267_05015 [Planctomycetes bacterium]|nr:hypothetical protein [Planctomycetota bacterium]